MTLEQAKGLEMVKKGGLTVDISRWGNGYGASSVLYLAGRVAFIPNHSGSHVCCIRHPDAKRRKSIRINRRKSRDWRTAALLRLGFTEVEIGTAKFLARQGIMPA